jgi:hypothetical protein
MSEVMLIRWPEEAEIGTGLARAGVAVLYLVSDHDDPPGPTTCLEDWIRIPGDDRDLRARVRALELRAMAHHAPPRVDEGGRLHYRGQVLVLSEHEARLARLLTDRFGDLVPDDVLQHPEGDHQSPLRGQMAQLRSRLRALDLVLRRISNRGYVLQRR